MLDQGLVVEEVGLVLSQLEDGFGVCSEFAEFAVLSGFGCWTGNCCWRVGFWGQGRLWGSKRVGLTGRRLRCVGSSVL